MSRETKRTDQETPATVEVQICQAKQTCWVYSWDQDRAQLRVQGVAPGQQDLPADLAVLRLEQQREVPVYLLVSPSIAPGASVPVRILGAFQLSPSPAEAADAFPLARSVLLAIPDLPGLPPCYETLGHIPHVLLTALREHARTQVLAPATHEEQPAVCEATEVARQLRVARLWLKRARRQPGRTRLESNRREDAQAVAWRAVEALTPEQRTRIAQARTLEALTPLLQAEQLIRFVPARFQKALEHVLLADERLLAFVERPLMRNRTGWLGLQQSRAHAGLFLLTDTQVLWLRDFFSPGSSVFPEGYIARSVPLERLAAVQVMPASKTGGAAGERQISSLLLRLSIESREGCENLDVAFPENEMSQKALARIVPLIQAFVPQDGSSERHVRCLPVAEPWVPVEEEARKLSGLGGIVPAEQRARLEQGLAETLRAAGEELLASAMVPALEQYRSPARLVALTRMAVLICELPGEPVRRPLDSAKAPSWQMQRYDLAQISSVQLSYSLLGSDLRLSLPQQGRTTQEYLIPFPSPAIARFLPLFTRLRLLLRAPLPQDLGATARPGQEEVER